MFDLNINDVKNVERELKCNKWENRVPLPEGIARDFVKPEIWNFTEDNREEHLAPNIKVNENGILDIELPVKKSGSWTGVVIDFKDVKNASSDDYLAFDINSSTNAKDKEGNPVGDGLEVKFGIPNDRFHEVQGINNSNDFKTVTLPLSTYLDKDQAPEGQGRFVIVVADRHVSKSEQDVVTQRIQLTNIRIINADEVTKSLNVFKK